MPINPSPAVQRAGQVLWYLAEHPSEAHTVSELARVLSIPRATCDSILQALTQQGFVSRREREMAYELGASCLALASAAQAANTVLNMASREAELLARELRACVVVSTVITGEARAVAVFDRGPSTMLRARVGQVIPLAPPFGVVFVAFDGSSSDRWLQQAGDDADPTDADRWRQSLQFTRRHGYSFSVHTPPGIPFGRVLDDLIVAPDSEPDRRARDELIKELRHNEYLATHVDHDNDVLVIQISAPVFDANGTVAASIMVLGSTRPMRGADIEELGRKVVQAADNATMKARQLRLGQPASAG